MVSVYQFVFNKNKLLSKRYSNRFMRTLLELRIRSDKQTLEMIRKIITSLSVTDMERKKGDSTILLLGIVQTYNPITRNDNNW